MSWSVRVWKEPEVIINQTIRLRQLASYLKDHCPDIASVPTLPHIIKYSMLANGVTKQRIKRIEIKRGLKI